MSSCPLMFPGVRSFLEFSSFGFKPPASSFQSVLTVVSRLLHPYSTNDKISMLMVKRFSTVRDTQRGSQSYMEKRRERREIEVVRRRSGEIKRGKTNLAMFSTVLNTRRGSQSYIEKRRGRKNIEVTRRRRGGVKRRETI